jgi:hypothetical protein
MPRKRTPTRACIADRTRPSRAWRTSPHLLIENRHELIPDAMATIADGFAELEAATVMVHELWHRTPSRRRTLAADEGYDRSTS